MKPDTANPMPEERLCISCSKPATTRCDYEGQFVCGYPLCDDCEGYNVDDKPAVNWGFMNHFHRKIDVPAPQDEAIPLYGHIPPTADIDSVRLPHDTQTAVDAQNYKFLKPDEATAKTMTEEQILDVEITGIKLRNITGGREAAEAIHKLHEAGLLEARIDELQRSRSYNLDVNFSGHIKQGFSMAIDAVEQANYKRIEELRADQYISKSKGGQDGQ